MSSDSQHSNEERSTAVETAGMLGIGALSRATGIAVETLRTWERRYGYPKPARTDAGHRLYATDTVERLKLVSRAIDLGHRASNVVSLDTAHLKELLASTVAPAAPVEPDRSNTAPPTALNFGIDRGPREPAPPAPDPAAAWLSAVTGGRNLPVQFETRWLDATRRFDEHFLDRQLRIEWGHLGTVRFLSERVGPFLTAVGEAWREGRLTVSQEHFASERVRDFLTGVWRPLSDRNDGAPILCASLPNEQHHLGLHMVACVCAVAGHRVVFLGAGAPVIDIASACVQSGAAAVVVSVSAASDRTVSRSDLAQLRRAIPRSVAVVAGGAGCPEDVEGVLVPPSLMELSQWIQSFNADESLTA
jgi:methylmalonyl-CoA mutase cobalamin-binding subunit